MRLQLDALEPAQRANRLLDRAGHVRGRANIDLRYRRTGNITRVLNRKAHAQRVVITGPEIQIMVRERGVGQTLTEWELRLDLHLVEVAIPRVDALGEAG